MHIDDVAMFVNFGSVIVFNAIKKQNVLFFSFLGKTRKLCRQSQLVSIILKFCLIWLKLTKPWSKFKSVKIR